MPDLDLRVYWLARIYAALSRQLRRSPEQAEGTLGAINAVYWLLQGKPWKAS